MSAIALSCIAFACISGGVLLGMFLRNALPEHHLSSDAKDLVRLGTGLIGTIAALVLGLLIGSAKSSYSSAFCRSSIRLYVLVATAAQNDILFATAPGALGHLSDQVDALGRLNL